MYPIFTFLRYLNHRFTSRFVSLSKDYGYVFFYTYCNSNCNLEVSKQNEYNGRKIDMELNILEITKETEI